MPFRVPGLVKEVFYTLLICQVFLSIGIGRSYVVFLFHQLDLPGSRIIINDEQKSRIASSIGILSPLACILSGTLMDLFGRKLYFIVTFIPQIISWVIIASATSYEMLLFGMIIQGINLGMGFIGNVYIPEIVLPSHRGFLLPMASVIFNSGVMLCNTLMYYVSWNKAAWIYASYSLISMLSMFLISESPLWLFTKGKDEVAIQTLSSLRSSTIDDIKTEIEDMKQSAVKKDRSIAETMKNILSAWKQAVISIVLQFLFQMTGYTALFGYTILFFNRLQLPIDSSKFTIVYTFAGIIGVCFTPLLMQKLNRRTHLMLLATVMTMCTSVVGIYLRFFNNTDEQFPYVVPIAFYVFSFVCNAGVMPISYSLGSEIFPGEVRGIMNGIFGMGWYVSWAGVLKFFPNVLNTFDVRTILWVFTGFCVSVILFAKFVVPETKGKTLNEVQRQYFQKKENQKNQKVELESASNMTLATLDI